MHAGEYLTRECKRPLALQSSDVSERHNVTSIKISRGILGISFKPPRRPRRLRRGGGRSAGDTAVAASGTSVEGALSFLALFLGGMAVRKKCLSWYEMEVGKRECGVAQRPGSSPIVT